MMEVEYRSITGFPGYMVGSDGSVWSQWERGRWNRRLDYWKRMLTPTDSHGYPQLNLYSKVHGKCHFKVHRLVLKVFIGPRPDGLMTLHANGIRSDNRLENLSYGTPLENAADTERHGRTSRGVGRPSAKLTDDDVIEIRRQVSMGKLQKTLAFEYGVSRATICEVVKGKVWRHVRS